MPTQSTFSNLIHIRDFVDDVIDDPTRDGTPNYVVIQAEINIFEEDGFYSSDVKVEPIHALIHTYLTREERDLYVPNTFFFADGRFSATPSPDGTLEIIVQTLSLKRHPGDVSDFDEYRRHLPEQWCPMLTIIGSVLPCNNNTVDALEPRRFAVETSVYEPSKPGPMTFVVACFLENTKRWHKVKIPPAGTLISLAGKVVGHTADTNQLALRVLDLSYLPRPASAVVTLPSAATPSSIRSARWEGRPTPATPSKRPRLSDPPREVANPSYDAMSPPLTATSIPQLPLAGDSGESPSVLPSPSTIADPEESTITLAPSPNIDSGPRPHRLRQPPKKYPTVE